MLRGNGVNDGRGGGVRGTLDGLDRSALTFDFDVEVAEREEKPAVAVHTLDLFAIGAVHLGYFLAFVLSPGVDVSRLELAPVATGA